MRTNMSVTIVAMVRHAAKDDSVNATMAPIINPCGVENIVADVQDPTQRYFPWSETIQGHILGAYYYGYILTNINGGQLADKFGPRWMCGIITLISSLLTLLTPLVAEMDEIMLILLRIGTGLCQGVLTPAIYSLLAFWIPRNERALVLALIQVGGYAGAVMTTILSGILSSTVGWKWVFYVFGCFGIFCFFVWMYVIYNTPAEHPRILEEELIKIKMTVNVSAIASTNKANRPPVPWRAIWLSVPVWSISIAKFCGAWGNLMLMSKLPSYLKSILHVSITNNGYITSAVYVALSISLTSFGIISDKIGQKRLISDTWSRKIFETIALGGPAICLILVPQFGCNLGALISLLVISMLIFGMNAGGEKPIVVDVAPDHSGTIYGITNAIASFPGILAPLLVGYLTSDPENIREGWNWVFYSASGIYLFGMVIFLLFATAEPQPWGILERPRGMSRAASRAVSRGPSRGPSRKATMIHEPATPNSKNASRRATFRGLSHDSSKIATPHSGLRDDQVYTIDSHALDKALHKTMKQSSDEERDNSTHVSEYDPEFYTEDIEGYFDHSEDDEQFEEDYKQQQKERRYSVFHQ